MLHRMEPRIGFRLNAACGLAITLILPMACIAASMQSSTGFSMGAFNRSIPYQDALDDAGISQAQLNSIINNSLIQGNGDVNSILYAKDSKLVLELTKNDVYDARIDTSNDHPLLKIDVANHSWSGTVAIPSSWGPIPNPACVPRSSSAPRAASPPCSTCVVRLQLSMMEKPKCGHWPKRTPITFKPRMRCNFSPSSTAIFRPRSRESPTAWHGSHSNCRPLPIRTGKA